MLATINPFKGTIEESYRVVASTLVLVKAIKERERRHFPTMVQRNTHRVKSFRTRTLDRVGDIYIYIYIPVVVVNLLCCIIYVYV